MKAGVIEKAGILTVKELPVPELTGENQVLIRVKMVGICGSDVHILHGENPFASYPRIFGHEFTGEVVKTGAKITRVQIGDHVVGEPIVSCGKCYACRNGRPNVCEKLKVMGVHMEGGCAEYVAMEEDHVYPIGREVPWSCAVLAEPMTIGYQSTSRGRVQPGDVVLILGTGTIGACCLMAAKAKGATCICTDLVEEKLTYARKIGADYTINPTKEDVRQRVLEITRGMGPNVVLDSVCTKESLEEAADMVSVAGRVVELGFGSVASEIPHVTLMKKEVDLCGTRLQAGKFPVAIDYVEKNWRQLTDYVTQYYSLEDVEEAFAFAEKNPREVRKIVVKLS